MTASYQSDVWLDGSYLGEPRLLFSHSFDVTLAVNGRSNIYCNRGRLRTRPGGDHALPARAFATRRIDPARNPGDMAPWPSAAAGAISSLRAICTRPARSGRARFLRHAG